MTSSFCQPQKRVLRLAVAAHLEIQLRAFQASRVPGQSDYLTPGNPVVFFQIKPGKVPVKGVKTRAMLNDDQIAVSLVPIREGHLPVAHRVHSLTFARAYLNTASEHHGLELRMLLHPELGQHLALNRPGKLARSAALRTLLDGACRLTLCRLPFPLGFPDHGPQA